MNDPTDSETTSKSENQSNQQKIKNLKTWAPRKHLCDLIYQSLASLSSLQRDLYSSDETKSLIIYIDDLDVNRKHKSDQARVNYKYLQCIFCQHQ